MIGGIITVRCKIIRRIVKKEGNSWTESNSKVMKRKSQKKKRRGIGKKNGWCGAMRGEF